MSFNSDSSKQAQEVFSAERLFRPLVYKYDSTKLLIFDIHIKTILAKETLGLLKRFKRVSPRSSLATICKSFVRPHLDLVISSFFQAFHNSFHQRMESISIRRCFSNNADHQRNIKGKTTRN